MLNFCAVVNVQTPQNKDITKALNSSNLQRKWSCVPKYVKKLIYKYNEIYI